MADLKFEVIRNTNPKPDAEREELLKAPVFGANLTDHQVVVVWEKDKGWHSAQVIPYGPIMMDPSAAVLHYGQEIFEGIKAYRHADGSIWTFRPEANAARLQRSAHRMALPELPTEIFVESLKQLIAVDGAWVPEPVNEKTLYIRPFEIAAENFLGVRAAHRAEDRRAADGGHREAAAQVSDERVGGAEQLLRQARARDEVAHQDEQRHHAQRVGEAGVVDHLRRRRRGRPPATHQPQAGKADEAHREGQRHAQQRQPLRRGHQHLGRASAAVAVAVLAWAVDVEVLVGMLDHRHPQAAGPQASNDTFDQRGLAHARRTAETDDMHGGQSATCCTM